MSRILVTGGSGLLALNWACRMRDLHEITLAVHSKKVSLSGVNTVQLNLDSAENIATYLLQNDLDIWVQSLVN